MKTMEQGLKKARVLTKFKRAFKVDRKGASYNISAVLNDFLSAESNKLGGAFTWLDTNEGHDFWSETYTKLDKYFKQ